MLITNDGYKSAWVVRRVMASACCRKCTRATTRCRFKRRLEMEEGTGGRPARGRLHGDRREMTAAPGQIAGCSGPKNARNTHQQAFHAVPNGMHGISDPPARFPQRNFSVRRLRAADIQPISALPRARRRGAVPGTKRAGNIWISERGSRCPRSDMHIRAWIIETLNASGAHAHPHVQSLLYTPTGAYWRKRIVSLVGQPGQGLLSATAARRPTRGCSSWRGRFGQRWASPAARFEVMTFASSPFTVARWLASRPQDRKR